MTEIRNMKQAALTFYTDYNRLPGDTNKDGILNYSDSLPASHFNDINDGYNSYDTVFYPDLSLAELGLDGIIDFRLSLDYNIMFSKIIKNASYYYRSGEVENDASRFDYGTNNKNFLALNPSGYGKSEDRMPAKILKNIDDKMDDGEYNKGSMRSDCVIPSTDSYGNISYDEAIEDENVCDESWHMIDI